MNSNSFQISSFTDVQGPMALAFATGFANVVRATKSEPVIVQMNPKSASFPVLKQLDLQRIVKR